MSLRSTQNMRLSAIRFYDQIMQVFFCNPLRTTSCQLVYKPAACGTSFSCQCSLLDKNESHSILQGLLNSWILNLPRFDRHEGFDFESDMYTSGYLKKRLSRCLQENIISDNKVLQSTSNPPACRLAIRFRQSLLGCLNTSWHLVVLVSCRISHP